MVSFLDFFGNDVKREKMSEGATSGSGRGTDNLNVTGSRHGVFGHSILKNFMSSHNT